MEDYFLEWLTAPEPLLQNPLPSPLCETCNHSSSHKFLAPDIDEKTQQLSNNIFKDTIQFLFNLHLMLNWYWMQFLDIDSIILFGPNNKICLLYCQRKRMGNTQCLRVKTWLEVQNSIYCECQHNLLKILVPNNPFFYSSYCIFGSGMRHISGLPGFIFICFKE